MEELNNEKSIGSFLMSVRKRVQPETVGLKRTQRRRTPGLRREEVAELANIGVSWYTSIEQGKVVHPSTQVLESIASALKLSTPEKNYLFELASLQKKPLSDIGQEVPDEIKTIVMALNPNPTYIIDYTWQIIEWNPTAELIFDYSSYNREEQKFPNLLNHFLLSDHMKTMIDDWENRAKVMVDRYKADFLKNPQDEKFISNIEFLRQENSLFKEEWDKKEIRVLKSTNKSWLHPQLGEVKFKQVIMNVPELLGYQMFTFVADQATKAKIETKLK